MPVKLCNVGKFFLCLAAQAMILGAEDVYVKKGSTISLTCSVNVHSSPPGSVVWYQGNTVVDFESSRGGISLETEKTEAGTTSKLLVTKASLADSGNYTCLPSNANPASVFVHVLNGETSFHLFLIARIRALGGHVALFLDVTATSACLPRGS